MKFTIVGIGLIGGSLAKSLRTLGLASKIFGVDSNSENGRVALKMGLIDEVCELPTALAQSDGVILSVPVSAASGVLIQILSSIGPDVFVTDMGSTKLEICQTVRDHAQRGNYIASHPMAGTENSGPTAAEDNLFDGKTVVICEKELSTKSALSKVETIFTKMNMCLSYMSAAEHDLHAAFVSHLSHISSFVLANTVLTEETNTKTIFDMAGGGFESTVRLAKSSPKMWAPIFEQNRDNILKALSSYIDHMVDFRESIQNRNFQKTTQLMENANQIRRVLESMGKK